jgi:predicted ferric reductase
VRQLVTHRLGGLLGPFVLAFLYLVPLVLWAATAPLDTRFDGRFQTLTSIAVLLAYAGISAFALNLVLGARLRAVEVLFGGLERMYRAHRVNGELAFALLLGHVLLILASRATISTETALDLLGPGAGWTVFAGVLAFTGMTVAIVVTLFVRVNHELFVYVQRSFGVVFLGATYHVFTSSGPRSDSRALNLYLAGLATLGIAAFVYRSMLGSLLVHRRRYRLVAVDRLDEHVTEFELEPLGKPLAFAPGQFVFVCFHSPTLDRRFGPLLRNQFHPFSITSAPGERTLRITVKAVGDYTRAMRLLEPGAEAVVEGPYGSFGAETDNERQVWIAGGIGVTPFLSMARSLNGASGPAVDFYYCVEHAPEAHFLDELHSIARERDGFRVVLVPRETDGLLTGERLAAENEELASTDVLVCGPPAMIDSLRPQLSARGAARERFHAEEFGFAKIGRPRAAEELPPGALRSDPKLLALLAAVAFAGPALALALLIGTYLLARGR